MKITTKQAGTELDQAHTNLVEVVTYKFYGQMLTK